MSAVARRAFRRGAWTWQAICPACSWQYYAPTRGEVDRFAAAHNDVHHAPTGAHR